MTEEEHEMIREIRRDIAEVKAWIFTPPRSGQPPRAEDLDAILIAVRTGKLGARVVIWTAGVIIAVAAAANTLKDWFGFGQGGG